MEVSMIMKTHDMFPVIAVMLRFQVNLAAKNITKIVPKAFDALGCHVERLSLANNTLSHLAPGRFAGLWRVGLHKKRRKFCRFKMSLRYAAGLKCLQQLDLTNVGLEELHDDSFSGLERLKLLSASFSSMDDFWGKAYKLSDRFVVAIKMPDTNKKQIREV